MKKEGTNISLVSQTYEGEARFYSQINDILTTKGLKKVCFAVAYARWDGLGLISEKVERFLRSGGILETVYGFDNEVTSPDSFLYGLYLKEIYSGRVYCGAFEDKFRNAVFHPKLLLFHEDDRLRAMVGSANLTGAGLSRNIELGTRIEALPGSKIAEKLKASWEYVKNSAVEVDISFVRSMKAQNRLHQERDSESGQNDKPALSVGAKVAPKPLFAKVLNIENPRKRESVLRNLDPLSKRPRKLYLQILAGETGAPNSSVMGYQIQLPVATLATYFGVGPAQTKEVLFHFPSADIHVHLTHFENHTHRVRLRPLRDVPRPAIVIFERDGPNEFSCSVVPRRDYVRVLAAKCNQQTRAGARKWGLE
jgi:HKD family nuclease